MRVIKETVLGVKGGYVAKGRVVLYHGDRLRRTEMTIHYDQAYPNSEVGYTVAELQQVVNKFLEWLKKENESVEEQRV